MPIPVRHPNQACFRPHQAAGVYYEGARHLKEVPTLETSLACFRGKLRLDPWEGNPRAQDLHRFPLKEPIGPIRSSVRI